MNKDRLKLIIKNMELLLAQLKTEVYSDTESYRPDPSTYQFEDDDGYAD